MDERGNRVIRGTPIGERFTQCTFENFEVTNSNREAYEACRRLAAGGKQGVVIRGSPGLGKTHLLVALMKEFDSRHSHALSDGDAREELIQVPSASELIASFGDLSSEGPSAPSLSTREIASESHIEYWPLLDLVCDLRLDIRQGSSETSYRCRHCDLLVLDDFGAERASDFVLEELERIVDSRYRTMKLTAVATNLDFKKITAKYGQRAISRWAGSCEGVTIHGTDRRLLTPRKRIEE